MAVIGAVGGASTVLKWGDLEITTTNTGLVILVVGAVLASIIAKPVAENVRVFQGGEESLTERVAERGRGAFLLIAVVGIILFFVSFIFRGFV